MITYFVANPQSNFFESEKFKSVLNYIQSNPKACIMKERNNKLCLVFDKVTELEVALYHLNCILER